MNKKIGFVLGVMLALSIPSLANAVMGGFSNEKFTQTYFFESGGKGAKSGLGEANAKDIKSQTIAAIPAGVVIENAYMVIDTAVAGSLTGLSVGDSSSSNGWLNGVSASSASFAAGLYEHGSSASYKATGKYYLASDILTMALAGSSASSGKMRVVIDGYKLAY